MTRIAFILLTAVLLAAGLAQAETREKRLSEGSWTFYAVDDLDVTFPQKTPRVLDGMCLAEHVSDKFSFQIVMMSAETADSLSSVRGCPWAQIASPDWNFRERALPITLSGVFAMTIGGAEFSGDHIRFSVGGVDDCAAFKFFMLLTRETIEVKAGREIIARIPAKGFPPVRQALLECAGVAD